ncbi:PREDICTED: fibroblast growth factor 21 [Crocodylus porosus]|uniref:Fibroblast growth factor n=1 Tax=Crocodylus porosus TaxID=8502 RepID=A0A7M4FFF5_CROPO|nr:PREDICTED: fibroblast growth factor 21 [Crocodylus porosus]
MAGPWPRVSGPCWLLAGVLLWGASSPGPALGSPLRDSSPLLALDGQVRLRHLYTANEHTQLHLEILPDGHVRGVPQQSPYSLMEIKAVKPGVVQIQAAKSLQFLCMDVRGRLYGVGSYSTEACNFREKVLSDGYNLYISERHNRPLSLTPSGALPGTGRPGTPLMQWLPLVSHIPAEPVLLEYPFSQPGVDADSADPLGILGRTPEVLSPSYII